MPCGGPPLTPSAGSPPRSHRSGAGRRRGSGDRLLERLANSISSIASSHGSKSPSLTQRCFNSYPSQRRNDSKSRSFSCARNFFFGEGSSEKTREKRWNQGRAWFGSGRLGRGGKGVLWRHIRLDIRSPKWNYSEDLRRRRPVPQRDPRYFCHYRQLRCTNGMMMLRHDISWQPPYKV